jgi:TRAP-type C4-dicarboxylate transport system substrate-binding protein
MNTQVVSFGVGAMVISQDKLNELPQDMRDMMQKLGAATSRKLAENIRKQDDLAFGRLKTKMGENVYTPTGAEVEDFRRLYRAACANASMALDSNVLKEINPDKCKKDKK